MGMAFWGGVKITGEQIRRGGPISTVQTIGFEVTVLYN
jgi:hypothetical protein